MFCFSDRFININGDLQTVNDFPVDLDNHGHGLRNEQRLVGNGPSLSVQQCTRVAVVIEFGGHVR
jgi:hypothetical protein